MTDNATALRHSAIGIASLCISCVVIFCFIVVIAIAGALTGSGAATSATNTIVGFAAIFIAMVDLVGVALAIAGLVDGSAKKVFPILGLTLGIGALAIVAALVWVGMKT
jgi:hypothetical protein